MDGSHFDDLAKRLATRPSRRRLLAALGGGVAGLVGSGLALVGRPVAADGMCTGGCTGLPSGRARERCLAECWRADAQAQADQERARAEAEAEQAREQARGGLGSGDGCNGYGNFCASTSQCCAGLVCSGEHCVNGLGSGGPGCARPGTGCIPGVIECCTGTCPDSGFCPCQAQGGRCSADSQCCSFSCGANGTCQASSSCPSGCVSLQDASGAYVCANPVTAQCGVCFGDSDCPTGYGCIPMDVGCEGACVALC